MHNTPSSFKLPSENIPYPPHRILQCSSQEEEGINHFLCYGRAAHLSLSIHRPYSWLLELVSSSVPFEFRFYPWFLYLPPHCFFFGVPFFVSLPLWEPVDVDMMAILKRRDQM